MRTSDVGIARGGLGGNTTNVVQSGGKWFESSARSRVSVRLVRSDDCSIGGRS